MVTSDDCQDCSPVVARAGETNRVPLLIGVEWPFDGMMFSSTCCRAIPLGVPRP
ncbi:MAG: hypothetical protein ACI4UY_00700 [Kiritimatiellia bacterium]